MGLDGILDTGRRGDYFRHVLTHLGGFDRSTPEWMTEAFLKTTGGDAKALLLILDTFVDTRPEELAAIDLPALVVTGAEDDDNGSGTALAEMLPKGEYVEVPGNHMSAVTRPDLGRAMADFLSR